MALGYPNLPLMLSHIQVFALADLFTWNVLLNLVLSVEILPILPDPTMNTTFLMKPCQISLNLVIFLFKGLSSGLHSSLVAFVMFTLDPGNFMLLEEQHTHTHTHTEHWTVWSIRGNFRMGIRKSGIWSQNNHSVILGKSYLYTPKETLVSGW